MRKNKMKSKNDAIQQEIKRKTDKTKRYDEVLSKIRKLISAGASYIGELCDALAEDWYPHLTTDMIQRSDIAKSDIREKILNDLSKDRHPEGVWVDTNIIFHFRPWLKDPVDIERGRKGGLARAQNFELKMQDKKPAVEKLVQQLPEPPKPPKQEEPDTESAIEVDEPYLRPLGEKGQIPFISMTELNSAQYRLWNILTGKEEWAHVHDDLQNDHIKPTREHRSSFLQELEPHEQNGIARRCGFLIAVLEDTIQTIEGLQK